MPAKKAAQLYKPKERMLLCDVYGRENLTAALPERHFHAIVAAKRREEFRLALWTRAQVYACRDGFLVILPIKHDERFSTVDYRYERVEPTEKWALFDLLFDECIERKNTLDIELSQMTPAVATTCQQAHEDTTAGKPPEWWRDEPETVLVPKTVNGKTFVTALHMSTRLAIVLTEKGIGLPPEPGPPRPFSRFVPQGSA